MVWMDTKHRRHYASVCTRLTTRSLATMETVRGVEKNYVLLFTFVVSVLLP